MVEPIFDHETLDVYQVSIEYLTASNGVAKSLTGVNRQLRDQWLEAAIALAVINAPRHNWRMIRSFGDKETERLFHRHAVKKIPLSVQQPALRKLLVLDAAESPRRLAQPTGESPGEAER